MRLIKRFYSSKKSIENAFTRRLAELEEEIIPKNDPLLGSSHNSLIDKDPKLIKLSNELEAKKFEHDNQKSIYTSQLPRYAGKQAKDIAYSQPWTGEESPKDSSLRMLVDKHKPLKMKTDIAKLANAKETVLDYRINKNVNTEEDSKFKELYQEKFTPIGSFDKIKTIADARIDEHIKQGGFKNLPRGQKLNTGIGNYVDRTEHHLNNILVTQNVVPPWIEKQGGVNYEISNFQNELVNKWKTFIGSNYDPDYKVMQSEFIKVYSSQYDHKIKLLNNSIRTYNLQAPMSTQKFYALKDKEFQKCFDSVDIPQVLKEHKEELLKRKLKNNQQSSTQKNGPGFWGKLFGLD
ncbi:DnaJ subfamily C member 28 [Wickerhamomyces ciferrii]|uniref:DnaJ subfamily C member 28 n=1 Tax=Wickerhamomyces ciferrii (strain ATCC 14091 / BCRC 22168 / CBS 111 / JCM 3599 / NBRC 0793 / NRRL Y-1031 F-60-10) TaxID=1206466 RepID=K0KVX3_WICCF|nr:DnaJ subfamily C member 28 [Wickerhamomyces ciferrii]CCH45654.1 DnaJ subfamily C member 28 [Wickerhamomyces ciferrii]